MKYSILELLKNRTKSEISPVASARETHLFLNFRATLLLFIFFFNFCVTVDENFEGRAKPISFSICFWNAEKLDSKKLIEWKNKKNYITELTKKCDSLSLTEIRVDNDNLSSELEDFLSKENLNYSCVDSILKLNEDGTIQNQTKYISCSNNNKVVEMKLIAYPDTKKEFLSPPSFFFLELTNGAKVSVLPFHTEPGNKNELIDFEKIVNFTYQKFSERKTFFGGDFYTDKKYQSDSFLKSLLYFQILKNLISEPSTFTCEKNDVIFTDNVSQLNCIGKVISLEQISIESGGQKEFEKISSHLPVVANCKIK